MWARLTKLRKVVEPTVFLFLALSLALDLIRFVVATFFSAALGTSLPPGHR